MLFSETELAGETACSHQQDGFSVSFRHSITFSSSICRMGGYSAQDQTFYTASQGFVPK